jgi:hypothetical protein
LGGVSGGTEDGTVPADPDSISGTGKDKGEGKGTGNGSQKGSGGGDTSGGKPGAEGSGTNEEGSSESNLDLATAIASMIIDPGSLAKDRMNGNPDGSPVGSSVGFISGGLASLLTILLAVFSLGLGGQLKKGWKKLNGGVKGLFSKRGLPGTSGPLALPPASQSPILPNEPTILTEPATPPSGGGPFREPGVPTPSPPAPEPEPDIWSRLKDK